MFHELVYWFAFLLSAAFGNPLPEEVMIAMGGIRTAQLDEYGAWRWLMFPACLLGALAADLVLYALGRLFGARLMDTPLLRWLAPAEKQARIRYNFHRYGIAIFVLGRMVPGFRNTLFLTAGTMRLSLPRFLVADGLGALIGTSLFFALGYALGAQVRDLVDALEARVAPYKPVALLLLLGGVVGYLTYLAFRHPIPTGDPEEVPLIGHQLAVHLPVQDEAVGDATTQDRCLAVTGGRQAERNGHPGDGTAENNPTGLDARS